MINIFYIYLYLYIVYYIYLFKNSWLKYFLFRSKICFHFVCLSFFHCSLKCFFYRARTVGFA